MAIDANLDVSSDAAPTEESTENTENIEESTEVDASTDGSEEGLPAATPAKIGTTESAEKKLKAAAAKKEEPKSNKKKLKIKVDGKEEDYEFDPDNEEEIRKHLQLSRVSQKRMSEMADMKRDVTELIQRLNKDPLSFMADKENGLGMDVEDLVKQYVMQKLADADKSPEQLKSEKMENELKRIKEEREGEKAQREKERYDAALQNEIIKYDNMITKTLENSEFKKPTPYVVKKMSDYLILAVTNGIDATTDDILPLVRDEIQSEIRELINTAPEEVIEAWFGKEFFNRMRKKNVANAKKAPVHASSIKDVGTNEAKAIKEADKISYKQFFKF